MPLGGDGRCSICFDLFTSPLATPCAHVFCGPCLKRALYYKKECPQCRAPTTRHELLDASGALEREAASDGAFAQRLAEAGEAMLQAVNAPPREPEPNVPRRLPTPGWMSKRQRPARGGSPTTSSAAGAMTHGAKRKHASATADGEEEEEEEEEEGGEEEEDEAEMNDDDDHDAAAGGVQDDGQSVDDQGRHRPPTKAVGHAPAAPKVRLIHGSRPKWSPHPFKKDLGFDDFRKAAKKKKSPPKRPKASSTSAATPHAATSAAPAAPATHSAGGGQQASHDNYPMTLRLGVVRFALRLPASIRLKPTCRAFPKIPARLINEWIALYGEDVCDLPRSPPTSPSVLLILTLPSMTFHDLP